MGDQIAYVWDMIQGMFLMEYGNPSLVNMEESKLECLAGNKAHFYKQQAGYQKVRGVPQGHYYLRCL